jgi:hypothetical protein
MPEPELNEESEIERKPRTPRADIGDDGPLVIGEPSDDGDVEENSPEDAIAKAADLAKEKDAELASERQRRQEAETAAAKANQTAQAATFGHVSEREAALTAHIESSKAASASAKAAYAKAMEEGDYAAAAEAQEQIASTVQDRKAAEWNLGQVQQQKERMAKAPPPRQQPTGDDHQRSSHAQKWLDDHPRFDIDPEYQASAITAHNAALSRNIAEGSEAYVNFIESRMTAKFGENHGEIVPVNRTSQPQNTRRASSTAAPPARGGDGNSGSINGGGSAVTIKHNYGQISLSKNARGEPVLRGTIPPEWREGARMCDMSDEAYAIDQLRIHAEAKAGGDTGLQLGDGRVYG